MAGAVEMRVEGGLIGFGLAWVTFCNIARAVAQGFPLTPALSREGRGGVFVGTKIPLTPARSRREGREGGNFVVNVCLIAFIVPL